MLIPDRFVPVHYRVNRVLGLYSFRSLSRWDSAAVATAAAAKRPPINFIVCMVVVVFLGLSNRANRTVEMEIQQALGHAGRVTTLSPSPPVLADQHVTQ